MAAAGAAAAIAATVVTVAWHARPSLSESDALSAAVAAGADAAKVTELELPTGDRIVAGAGARFEVDVPDGAERRVQLERGSMLFDVLPIDGGRFSVATPEADVVVLGTVFTVHAGEHGTTVYVYEGRVEVRRGNRTRIVTAGGVTHFGDGAPVPDLLEARGVEVAVERAASEASQRAQGPREHPARSAPERGIEAALAQRAATSPGVHEGRSPSPREELPEHVTPLDARAWIADGDPARALAAAQRATAAGEVAPWRMLEGDALRALGRTSEAADTYRRAASELASPLREQAGFVEARLRAMDLGDPEGALRALRGADVTSPRSALRERGLALEARLLGELGRDEERAAVARTYLRDHPDGPEVDVMREIIGRFERR